MNGGKQRITPHTLLSYVWPADPSVHPDGEKIAYTLKSVDADKDGYRTHIRVVTAAGRQEEAWTDGVQDMSPQWSPDGRQLAFLRLTGGTKQLFTLEEADGEAVQQTSAERGVGSFAWSPDSRSILYTTRTDAGTSQEDARRGRSSASDMPVAGGCGPGQGAAPGSIYDRTVPKAEGAGWWDGLYTHLFVVELQSGVTKRLTSGTFDAASPAWLPGGNGVAFLAKIVQDSSTDPDLHLFNDLFTLELGGGSLIRRTDSTLLISQFACAPDGSGYALLADDRRYGSGTLSRVYMVQAAAAKPEPATIDTAIQFGNYALNDMKSGTAAPGPFYAPDGRSLLVLGSLHGEVHVYRIDLSRELPAEPLPLTMGAKDIFQFECTSDGNAVYAAVLADDSPQELYRFDLQSGSEVRLTEHADRLHQELQLIRPQSYWIPAPDGTRLQGWVLHPPDLGVGERAPLVLMIHGGPHAMYTGHYSHEMQTLAAEGVGVLYINPRGSFGYGQSFAAACRGDFGGVDSQDLLAAVDWALASFDWIDGSRLGVAGGSYGGLMTNWLAARTDRFRAAVSQRCISNWLSFYGLSDIGLTYTEGIAGGNPFEDHALLWERSPLAHARDVQAPLLIMHGEQDFRCPIDQADQWYTALKLHGKTTRLIRYPGGHSFMKVGKPSIRIDAVARTNEWLVHYLIGAGAPARVQLPLPVALLIENCRTSGLDEEALIRCIETGDFSELGPRTVDPKMDFGDRAKLAEEMQLPWREAIHGDYSFGFLHLNGLKRLLLFRYGLKEGVDYHSDPDGRGLAGLSLSAVQAENLQQLIHRQWKVGLEARRATGEIRATVRRRSD